MPLAIDKELDSIASELLADYRRERAIDNVSDLHRLPNREVIFDCVRKLLAVIYPGYYRDESGRRHSVGGILPALLEEVLHHLSRQAAIALEGDPALPCDKCAARERARKLALEFLRRLPKVRAALEEDLQAAYEGDPAAFSLAEIIRAYPGLFAVSVHRLAHELYRLGIPLIPRVMSEYAHSKTGIDIHPGARIGRRFFIDHGTGVVIGQSTVIGNNVKIYQGVTLGALSTQGGQALRDVKRHPTIEDDVVIYAGASILGGNTVIGRGSVIGGNAFITASIRPGTRVSIKTNELDLKTVREKSKTGDPRDECWDYAI